MMYFATRATCLPLVRRLYRFFPGFRKTLRTQFSIGNISSRFRMRPALPPLQPSQTEKELDHASVKFVDFQQKTLLITKAHTTQIKSELNDIIRELQQIYTEDAAAMDILSAANGRKTQELEAERERYQKCKAAFDAMQVNTEILKVLGQRGLDECNATLAKKIDEIREQKRSYSAPSILTDVIQKHESPLSKWLHLTDLYFRELDQTVYILKKRGIAVDQSDQAIAQIEKEFGSVQNLIGEVRRLDGENSALKREESVFRRDPMTRRRSLRHNSMHGNRCMAVVLQTAVRDANRYGMLLRLDCSDHSAPHFDAVCSDPNFLDANAKSFSDDVKPRGDDPVRLIEALQEAVASQESICHKLIPDSESSGGFPRFALANDDPVAVNCERYFPLVRELSQRIEQASAQSARLTQSIFNALAEVQLHQRDCAACLDRSSDLKSAHVNALSWLLHNSDVVGSLRAVACGLGRALSWGNAALDRRLRPGAGSFPLAPRSPSPPQSSPKKKRKGRRGFGADRTPPLDLLIKPRPPNLLVALELAVGGRLAVLPFFAGRLQELRDRLREEIKGMRKFQRNRIGIGRRAYTGVLRKVYIGQKVQADLISSGDQAVQTEEAKKRKP
jgi:hypothetical protein